MPSSGSARSPALFLIWLGVRYTDSRVNPALLRRSTGLAIISWFIPILQWWWPVQSVKDLWHASRPEAARLGRGARLPFPAVFVVWWPAWLLSGGSPVALFLVADPRFESRFLDLMAISQGVSLVAMLVAAWALIVIIAQIEDHLVAPEDSTTEPTAF